MSSTPSTAASTPHTPAAQAAARQGARKPAGPENGSDQFSNLLMLLSATNDALPVEGWTPEQTGDAAATADDPGEAPLDAVLAWAQRPGASLGATGTDPGARGLPLEPRTASAAAGLAETASPPASGTPIGDVPGLQALARPQAPEPTTLARLATPSGDVGAAPTGGGTVPADAQGVASASNPPPAPTASGAAGRPAAWRATTQMAGTSALQQWHHTQSQTAPVAERLAVRVETGPAISLRSTVALDQRFAQSESEEASGPTPATAAALLAPHAAGADTSGHAGTGAETGAETGGDGGDAAGTPEGPHAEEAPESYEDALAEAEAQAEERFDRFTAPQLRQASLRVGEDGQDAIDVQLSLNGQELHLNFRTDNAEARAELRQNAESSLADLLQRGGLQLGDVNVSAQNGQAGQDTPAGARAHNGHTPRARSDASATADNLPAPAPARPRTDGSRPLDLFV
jgi:flagellar hook-length control protein FliK